MRLLPTTSISQIKPVVLSPTISCGGTGSHAPLECFFMDSKIENELHNLEELLHDPFLTQFVSINNTSAISEEEEEEGKIEVDKLIVSPSLSTFTTTTTEVPSTMVFSTSCASADTAPSMMMPSVNLSPVTSNNTLIMSPQFSVPDLTGLSLLSTCEGPDSSVSTTIQLPNYPDLSTLGAFMPLDGMEIHDGCTGDANAMFTTVDTVCGGIGNIVSADGEFGTSFASSMHPPEASPASLRHAKEGRHGEENLPPCKLLRTTLGVNRAVDENVLVLPPVAFRSLLREKGEALTETEIDTLRKERRKALNRSYQQRSRSRKAALLAGADDMLDAHKQYAQEVKNLASLHFADAPPLAMKAFLEDLAQLDTSIRMMCGK